MEALLEREVLLERRQYTPEEASLWDRLSLAQKFAASSMTQFGYDLSFIRNSHSGSLAILQCNDKTATINGEGEVNSTPSITIRP
ncbi:MULTISPECIES: hypothetical protein [unclassified Colwellia]|jgi:hypothetical protein|uniref:hypothetical protein n=1 Tax=unclassified Colwellia TaxID=196834 RepID=UPI0015F67571|nr:MULTISPECIES: hypothetical protein [unclassified Colwellia]MBA6231229.1 hypothetical protein [Colwellia sp. MB02u-7]MBA6238337.1 hypothetical protein [Colwellia sp. MB02u-11]MBA6255111.1 hypothetical protein [Colwellia sp. MB3u-28]MBA6260686.1 hypothetical protein [Colwellia sp. MB3u-41]MBA6299058.1 hypothetical protein [Colwellia sp. MB3u-22]